MSHPPTLVVQSCQSGSVRVGLFHGNIVKPELLIGLFSNVARFNSSEKWWKSPCCSQPVSDNQKPLPSMCCPKGLPAAVLQLCTKLARVLLQGGELGFQSLQLSEFPHLLWGWDLSSFKHLLAFWGGCTCKWPGWLWVASCCTPREQNVEYSLWSVPASQLLVPLSTYSPQPKKLQKPFIYQWFQCILPTSFSPHPSLHLNVPSFPMQSYSGP